MVKHHVYLVRHAKAAKDAQDDHSRRLTPEGRARFRRHLSTLRERILVTHILTSPLVRARETADILARATGAPVKEEPRLAAGESDGRELLALARAAPPGTALVGHNPEIAEAVARLAGNDLEVKPGSVAALEIEGREVRLAWLELPAKQ
jgi:phosphohistidine phosphatase